MPTINRKSNWSAPEWEHRRHTQWVIAKRISITSLSLDVASLTAPHCPYKRVYHHFWVQLKKHFLFLRKKSKEGMARKKESARRAVGGKAPRKQLATKAARMRMVDAPPKKSKFGNALEALRSATVVVADTGDVAAMEQYEPTDATTNPSLVLACLRYRDKLINFFQIQLQHRRLHTADWRGGRVCQNVNREWQARIGLWLPVRLSRRTCSWWNPRPCLSRVRRPFELWQGGHFDTCPAHYSSLWGAWHWLVS